MPERADVCIIGGGVVGCSIAYHLARTSRLKIVLLEQGHLGGGSTGRSAGGIRRQFLTAIHIQLSIESLKMFQTFREETGWEPGFRETGYLFLLSTEEERTRFRRAVELQRRLGVAVEVLSPPEIQRLVPCLRVDDVLEGTLTPGDGYASPHQVVWGYAERAADLGVQVRERCEVTGVNVRGGRVQGIESREGQIAAPVVINAAGPYAGPVGWMAGVEVPVTPWRRQLFVTAPVADLAREVPVTIDVHRNWYFRREEGGALIPAPTDRQSSFNTAVDWEIVPEVRSAGVHRLPALADVEIVRGWAGLYEISPDNHPILGESEVQGFYLACGFSGHGFMHGPVAGKLIAELILNGRTTGIDITPLSPQRFREAQLIQEPLTMHGVKESDVRSPMSEVQRPMTDDR
ncbi:MAG: FAD-binding oxidoreductase [candidate division NC10 bacterium]|nr:FAD-binding oxidoreductase [candidate division NC10 bacterium]MEC4670009.1 FAD-binding oxidoreductase [Nitrospirota bacterium]